MLLVEPYLHLTPLLVHEHVLQGEVIRDVDALLNSTHASCIQTFVSLISPLESVNGFPCKDAATITSLDFFSQGIANPGLTNNTFVSLVTGANVVTVRGLNTLGVSLARIDYAPGGLNPPHTHPRATRVDVGFLTTANKLFSQSLKKGDVFAFPKGLVHFQKNNGSVPALGHRCFQ